MGVSEVVVTGRLRFGGSKKRAAVESDGEEAISEEEGMHLEATTGRELGQGYYVGS